MGNGESCGQSQATCRLTAAGWFRSPVTITPPTPGTRLKSCPHVVLFPFTYTQELPLVGLPAGPLGRQSISLHHDMHCVSATRSHGVACCIPWGNEQRRTRLFKFVSWLFIFNSLGHWSNGPDSLCGGYVVSVLQADEKERLAARGSSSGVSGLGDAIPRPATYN